MSINTLYLSISPPRTLIDRIFFFFFFVLLMKATRFTILEVEVLYLQIKHSREQQFSDYLAYSSQSWKRPIYEMRIGHSLCLFHLLLKPGSKLLAISGSKGARMKTWP